MANERTFLAWIRTSIGIMAFGFVVEKFALFLKQLSHYFGQAATLPGRQPVTPQGYSSVLGIFLVALGALMGVLAFIRYRKVERQIEEETYQPSILLDVMLMLSLLAVGIFLVFVLVHSL